MEKTTAIAEFKTIGEVAEQLDIPQHVLRFWEEQFPQIKPVKRRGGRRFYNQGDIDLLLSIKGLLYDKGYTIKGAKKALKPANNNLALVSDTTSTPAIGQIDLFSGIQSPALTATKAVRPTDKDKLNKLLEDLQHAQKLLNTAL